MDEKMTRSTSADYEPFVDFKNLPDTTTPFDADNMNDLQIEMKKYIDDNRSIPAGGTQHQVLSKTSDDDYVVGWEDKTSGVPVGTMLEFAGTTPPDKYLLCDGQAVSRTDYAELFAIIGTMYGEGDGTTTFNVPDHKGRSAIGLNTDDSDFDTLGKKGGSKTHTQTTEELATHRHNFADGDGKRVLYWDAGLPSMGGLTSGSTVQYSYNSKTQNTGSAKPMNIMNPYLVSNYIIKAISG